ncbi:MAG: energy transducer TonB [bacterium]|nr:energy transducer TonB [bacterium]
MHGELNHAKFDNPSTTESGEPLERDTPVVTESRQTSERSPFKVGFSVSFGAVTLALLVVTAIENMDSIAPRLIPTIDKSAATVSGPRQQRFEPSALEAPAAPLGSSRLSEAPPIDDASEPDYEAENFAADFEDSLALPNENADGAQELALLPPISEPEPEIVQRTEAQLIRLPRPRYPMAARRQALRAQVRVKVLIGVDGNVKEVKLDGGPVGTGFDEAALAAAKDTRWMPATENEAFIETWTDLVIRFEP